MRQLFGLRDLAKYHRPVIVLGIFDGVHLGHRLILRSAVKKAREIRGTSIAITFWPHPREKESLYSLQHRLRLIEELGIDVCIVINFTKAFSEIRAEDFIKNTLFKKIKPREIYVGRNFRFGRGACGDIRTLKNLSRIYDFKLRVFRVIKTGKRPISSTNIRRLIRKGKINEARKILGRPVSILGTVTRGMRLGKILGFPTANINPHHEVIPAPGVYAVKVILDHSRFNGACYIGRKPTILAGNKKVHIEVYLLKLNKNLYGKYLDIQFIRRLRQERKFSSRKQLIKQIKKDINKVKKVFFLP